LSGCQITDAAPEMQILGFIAMYEGERLTNQPLSKIWSSSLYIDFLMIVENNKCAKDAGSQTMLAFNIP
jgi:hypothetical protein